MPTRRHVVALALGLPTLGLPFLGSARRAEAAFAVTLTEAEWQARLTPAQFAILRCKRACFPASWAGDEDPSSRTCHSTSSRQRNTCVTRVLPFLIRAMPAGVSPLP